MSHTELADDDSLEENTSDDGDEKQEIMKNVIEEMADFGDMDDSE
jgi:hypothetical protein